MQSWCQYSNTYKFQESPLNNQKTSTQIDVCSSFHLIYDNVIYQNNEKIKINNESNITLPTLKDASKKINNKLFNIDTNTYENIIYNKKEISINLFNELDSQILSISDNIIRNYLVKNVVYKFNRKIMEIQINQSNLLVSFHKVAKQFDTDNKLFDRKGYENGSICYSMIVEDNITCNYVVKIMRQTFDFLVDPPKNLNDILFDNLKNKITSISKSITCHYTNKGLVFKDNRNFVMISKTGYGVYLKLLSVNDDNHILNVITRKTYEPLCLSYKVKELSDIDIILPFIQESYKLNKINPIDLKNEYYKIYI